MGEVEENEIITLRLFFYQVFIFFFFSKHSELIMWASFAKRCLLSVLFCASVLFSDFSRALIHAYRHGKTSVEISRNKKDAPWPMDDSLFRDKVVAINQNQIRQQRSATKNGTKNGTKTDVTIAGRGKCVVM